MALRSIRGTLPSFSGTNKPAIFRWPDSRWGNIRAAGDAMLRISRDLTIDENDIEISFVLASDVAARLERLAGQRMTKDGVIVIHAQRFRTQERNRADAIDRLIELLREASVRPTPRRPTKPTLRSKKRRLEGKKRRSDVKAKRGSGGYED